MPLQMPGIQSSGIRALEGGASRKVSNKLREARETAQMGQAQRGQAQMGQAPWRFLYAGSGGSRGETPFLVFRACSGSDSCLDSYKLQGRDCSERSQVRFELRASLFTRGDDGENA